MLHNSPHMSQTKKQKTACPVMGGLVFVVLVCFCLASGHVVQLCPNVAQRVGQHVSIKPNHKNKKKLNSKHTNKKEKLSATVGDWFLGILCVCCVLFLLCSMLLLCGPVAAAAWEDWATS